MKHLHNVIPMKCGLLRTTEVSWYYLVRLGVTFGQKSVFALQCSQLVWNPCSVAGSYPYR